MFSRTRSFVLLFILAKAYLQLVSATRKLLLKRPITRRLNGLPQRHVCFFGMHPSMDDHPDLFKGLPLALISRKQHMSVAQNQRGGVTQVVVHVSTYQGSMLVPVF